MFCPHSKRWSLSVVSLTSAMQMPVFPLPAPQQRPNPLWAGDQRQNSREPPPPCHWGEGSQPLEPPVTTSRPNANRPAKNAEFESRQPGCALNQLLIHASSTEGEAEAPFPCPSSPHRGSPGTGRKTRGGKATLGAGAAASTTWGGGTASGSDDVSVGLAPFSASS